MTSKCRPGCPTQDHESYAACCRGVSFAIGVALTHQQKAWDAELKAYKNARAEGIQPDGTTMAKVEKAKKVSDATGVAYKGAGVH